MDQSCSAWFIKPLGELATWLFSWCFHLGNKQHSWVTLWRSSSPCHIWTEFTPCRKQTKHRRGLDTHGFPYLLVSSAVEPQYQFIFFHFCSRSLIFARFIAIKIPNSPWVTACWSPTAKLRHVKMRAKVQQTNRPFSSPQPFFFVSVYTQKSIWLITNCSHNLKLSPIKLMMSIYLFMIIDDCCRYLLSTLLQLMQL